jgi:hypothetical protein
LRLRLYGFSLFFFTSFSFVFAQNSINHFLKPADSLNRSRRNVAVVAESALSVGVLVSLNQLWYADYPQSDFHFINDNGEWLQMDKAGHVFSSYQLGRFSKELFQWCGMSQKNQLLYGSTFGFAFLTAVELMDGYSSQWGASWVMWRPMPQELLFMFLKNYCGVSSVSFQSFPFIRQLMLPLDLIFWESSWNEQIIKDYNGQTYWLSFNCHSFVKGSQVFPIG